MEASVRTPSLAHPDLAAFARQIKRDGILSNVKPGERLRPRGLSYWNVDATIKAKGGSSVLGWRFIEWPDFYFEAIHHAVWRTPDGRLIDVTNSDAIDRIQNRSVFMADDSIGVSLEYMPFVQRRHFALLDNPAVNALTYFYREKDTIDAEIAMIAYKCGARADREYARSAGQKALCTHLDMTHEETRDRFRHLLVRLNETQASIRRAINELRELRRQKWF